jgi:hypothetical protein
MAAARCYETEIDTRIASQRATPLWQAQQVLKHPFKKLVRGKEAMPWCLS